MGAPAAPRPRRASGGPAIAIAVGKLSGVVGTYSNVDPEVEAFVCEQLGLTPVPATQVVARDRHAEFLYACAVGASIELRHSRSATSSAPRCARSRSRSAGHAEGLERDAAQAQPVALRAAVRTGRVLRGNLQAGLEDIALWHERDISHSSVERIVLADSAQLAYYMLVQFGRIVAGMLVHPDRMLENLDSSYGLVFSQPVLLALVDAGHSRRGVPDRARRHPHMGERAAVPDVLAEDPEVLATLSRIASTNASSSERPRSRRSRGGRPGHLEPRRDGGAAAPLPGKVRELYDVDHDRMLIVASDRISVFDVVLDDLVPDKGRALTALSTFWFEETAGHPPNHLVSSDPTDFPETAGSDVAGRAMLVRATQPVRLECIGRGYLFGSAWSEYGDRGTVYGRALPSGLRQAERLPEPIFTATTKAESGTTSRSPTPPPPSSWAASSSSGFGRDHAARVRVRPHAAERGPHPRRHEARVRDHRRRAPRDRRDAHPGLVPLLARRRLPRSDLAAELRQAVRARPLPRHRLGPHSAGATPAERRHPGDTIPRYVEAYELLTGRSFDEWHRPEDRERRGRRTIDAPMRYERRDHPSSRDRRPARRDGGTVTARARLRQRLTGAVGKRIRLVIDAPSRRRARAQVDEMCRRLLANPVIEAYEIELSELASPMSARAGHRAVPGHELRARCRVGGRAARRDAELLWHAERRAPGATRSSSRAGSRTATTCARARSHGSRP